MKYKSIDPNWVQVDRLAVGWKKGWLSYKGHKGTLNDLHMIGNLPEHKGRYADIHVTLVDYSGNNHIWYQENDGKLVADYALAPHGWRATYWVNYPDLRETTEREALSFAQFLRANGKI